MINRWLHLARWPPKSFSLGPPRENLCAPLHRRPHLEGFTAYMLCNVGPSPAYFVGTVIYSIWMWQTQVIDLEQLGNFSNSLKAKFLSQIGGRGKGCSWIKKKEKQMFLFSDNRAVMQTRMRPFKSAPLQDIGMLSEPRQADPFRVADDEQGMRHVKRCSAALGSDFSKNENKMSTVQKRSPHSGRRI